MSFSAIFSAIKTSISAISGVQSSEVLRERIALINDQTDMLKEAHASTQKELTDAKIKIVELEEQIAAYREAEQFTHHEGAFFRKNTSGGYVNAVYCPNCRIQVGSHFSDFPFFCDSCKWTSSFNGDDLDRIIKSIP